MNNTIWQFENKPRPCAHLVRGPGSRAQGWQKFCAQGFGPRRRAQGFGSIGNEIRIQLKDVVRCRISYGLLQQGFVAMPHCHCGDLGICASKSRNT